MAWLHLHRQTHGHACIQLAAAGVHLSCPPACPACLLTCRRCCSLLASSSALIASRSTGSGTATLMSCGEQSSAAAEGPAVRLHAWGGLAFWGGPSQLSCTAHAMPLHVLQPSPARPAPFASCVSAAWRCVLCPALPRPALQLLLGRPDEEPVQWRTQCGGTAAGCRLWRCLLVAVAGRPALFHLADV